MASIRRKLRSPFWFACFTGADGSRQQLSTKQSDRRKAQAIANQWEKAAKLAGEKRLGEAQARRVLSDIYEITNNEPLASSSAKEFLDTWPEKRKAGISTGTYNAYKQACREFLASLGTRGERDISQIHRKDVAAYRDAVAARTTVSNANKLLKYLRVALGAAWKDGLIQENPAAKVDRLPDRDDDRTERRPFTLPEMKKILDAATPEWKSLILFGFYTGQRISDIGSLLWTNIDLQAETINFTSGKTGRRMEIPISTPLLAHIEAMPSADSPDAPVFPLAYPYAIKDTADSRLSTQFYDLLVTVGLAKKRSKDATGKGRKLRRNVSAVTFHSLRHTATSLLKNAGVSEVIAMEIVGHDSKMASRIYTHIDDKAKRRALAKLPNVLSE